MDDEDSNVIPFERPGQKNLTAVEILERTLERARSGELKHVGVCYVRQDGAVGHTWSEGSGFGPMLGSMHFMATSFVTDSRVIA